MVAVFVRTRVDGEWYLEVRIIATLSGQLEICCCVGKKDSMFKSLRRVVLAKVFDCYLCWFSFSQWWVDIGGAPDGRLFLTCL